ncbi:T9SS type A sorting domain-containing protein [Mesonia ostreae]|uniref:T9SS type A sorting domain-containing protein n=1 Tax=Mesonia ostreae TaxID=861110 RepID=A0ABU2KLP8_9FLAO|nr:T9SS type A sorting domain-containing protein [Mesonia ostreae]MDT0295604.1 T9SS type A sorting domain-containing protein [Mesonia ostreae]
MKKITFLLFFGICSFLQAQDYTVTAFNEPYQDLANATSVNNGQIWDDDFFAIPIGFNFELYGQNFSNIYISDIGNGAGLSFHTNPQANFSFLSPIMQDVLDKGFNQSVSPISYVMEGNVGDRIFKLEFKNVGFWGDDTFADYMDFQVWLYENDDSIEYRYGPNSINNPTESYEGETGPVVFFYPSFNIIDEGNLIEDGYYLMDDPVNPTILIVDNNTPEPANAIVGTILEGTVYRFDPDGLAVSNVYQMAVSFYPNPTQDLIHLQNPNQEDFKASLYDILGNEMNVQMQNEQMNLTSLASGTYFLNIKSKTRSKTIKVIKK